MQLSTFLTNLETGSSPNQTSQLEDQNQSVIFIKSVPHIEVITIEDSIIIQNNSTITIDDTTIIEQSLNSTQTNDGPGS